jgi:hypothetical protein
VTRRSFFRKLIYLPWAVSVAILCIGSLISFHQNKIWHKPLMLELVATKRENEKNLAQLSIPSFFGKVVPVVAGTDAILCGMDQPALFTTYLRLAEPSFTCTLCALVPGPNGLRAPPLA